MSAGVAASIEKLENDVHYEAEVYRAGGVFIPLVVETLDLWFLASLKCLRRLLSV